MTSLTERHCSSHASPVTDQEIEQLRSQLPGWTIEGGKLTRDFKVKNFKDALDLVNRIGELAEAENHHPDLCIHSWNHVKVELYTHSINGLSENDFILAAKIEHLDH